MSRIRAAEEGDLFELDGDAVNFDVEPDSLVWLHLRQRARPRGQRGWRDCNTEDHASADGHVRWSGDADQ